MPTCWNCTKAVPQAATDCPHCKKPLFRGKKPEAADGGGRYRIVRLLGEGGMGAVYKATDEHLKREVALKLVLPRFIDSAVHERLRIEARAMAQIAHLNVARVYDFDEHDGELFIVQEYIDGARALLDCVPDSLTDRAPFVAALAPGILAGLAKAHEKGVFHRDITLRNILVTEEGGKLRPVLIDFGLARTKEAPGGSTKAGSPGFAPWEQFLDPATNDGRTDVFAAAAVLYSVLTKQIPYFSAFSDPGIRASYEPIRDGKVKLVTIQKLNPFVARPLAEVIEKGLQVRLEERWNGPREFAAALDRAWAVRPACSVDQATAAKVEAALWLVETNAGFGTAFVVHPAGRLLAAAHLCRDAKWINIYQPGRQRLAARVEPLDEDLVVLCVETTQPLEWLECADPQRSGNISPGSRLRAVGFASVSTSTSANDDLVPSWMERGLSRSSMTRGIPFLHLDGRLDVEARGAPLFSALESDARVIGICLPDAEVGRGECVAVSIAAYPNLDVPQALAELPTITPKYGTRPTPNPVETPPRHIAWSDVRARLALARTLAGRQAARAGRTEDALTLFRLALACDAEAGVAHVGAAKAFLSFYKSDTDPDKDLICCLDYDKAMQNLAEACRLLGADDREIADAAMSLDGSCCSVAAGRMLLSRLPQQVRERVLKHCFQDVLYSGRFRRAQLIRDNLGDGTCSLYGVAHGLSLWLAHRNEECCDACLRYFPDETKQAFLAQLESGTLPEVELWMEWKSKLRGRLEVDVSDFYEAVKKGLYHQLTTSSIADAVSFMKRFGKNMDLADAIHQAYMHCIDTFDTERARAIICKWESAGTSPGAR